MMRERWKAGWARTRGTAERKPLEPERQLPDLERWEGLWVAIKNGKVIAAAHNSRELVPQLVEMGEAGRGAVAQYVPRRSDTVAIGVG
jgi:hypothetical protein